MELEALSIVRNCIWSNLDRKRHNLINKRTSRRWRRRGSRLIILWVQAGAAIAMTFCEKIRLDRDAVSIIIPLWNLSSTR